MKLYSVTLEAVLEWDLPIFANNQKEAIEKAKLYNKNPNISDGVFGVAGACTRERSSIRITRKRDMMPHEDAAETAETIDEYMKKSGIL